MIKMPTSFNHPHKNLNLLIVFSLFCLSKSIYLYSCVHKNENLQNAEKYSVEKMPNIKNMFIEKKK
jgi:hypothetical protein